MTIEVIYFINLNTLRFYNLQAILLIQEIMQWVTFQRFEFASCKLVSVNRPLLHYINLVIDFLYAITHRKTLIRTLIFVYKSWGIKEH